MITRIISGEEKLVIEKLDGREYISKGENGFSFVEDNFGNWGLNKPGAMTSEIIVDVSETIHDGTLIQIFSGISNNLDELVMTQAQIIKFCKKYSQWLNPNYYVTLFLSETNGEYSVIKIILNNNDELSAMVCRLGSKGTWRAKNVRRIVHPRLFPHR